MTLAISSGRPGRAWVRCGLGAIFALAHLAVMQAVWRLRFETNDDLAFAYLLWGRELLPAQDDLYFFFRGLAGLLASLEDWFGPTAYSAFLFALLGTAVARWVARILATGGSGADPWRLLTVLVVTGYVLAVTFWTVNFTRVAFFAVFVGFHGWSAGCGSGRRGPGSWLDLALVAVGYAVRPQAGLLALGAVFALSLFEGPRWRRLLPQTAFGAAVVLAFLAYDALSTDEREREYIRRNEYQTNLLDFGTGTLPPRTELDAARLYLARSWLLFDDQAYNAEFLAEYVQPLGPLMRTRLEEAPQRFASVVRDAFSRPWLWAVLSGAVGAALAGGRRWRTLAIPGKALAMFACLLACDILFTTKSRVVEPVLAALALDLLLASLGPGQRARKRRPVEIVVAVLATLVVFGALARTAERWAGSRRDFDQACDRAAAEISALERLAGGRVVLWTLPYGLFTANRPLSVRLPARDLALVPLSGWLTQFPDYRNMLDEIGAGNGAAGLLAEIERRPQRFLFVGDASYLQALVAYAALAHGRELRVVERSGAGLTYYEFARG